MYLVNPACHGDLLPCHLTPGASAGRKPLPWQFYVKGETILIESTILAKGITVLPTEKHLLCCGLINLRKNGKGKERKEKKLQCFWSASCNSGKKTLSSPHRTATWKTSTSWCLKAEFHSVTSKQRAWLQWRLTHESWATITNKIIRDWGHYLLLHNSIVYTKSCLLRFVLLKDKNNNTAWRPFMF